MTFQTKLTEGELVVTLLQKIFFESSSRACANVLDERAKMNIIIKGTCQEL